MCLLLAVTPWPEVFTRKLAHHLAALLALSGLSLVAPDVHAQVIDFARDREPMVELTGPWRFHTGDDPAWAKPGFDDSRWSLLTADKGWSDQGYQGHAGLAWYRIQIVLPAQHGPLAFYLPKVDSSCQVFANGRLIGQVGRLPPHPLWVQQSRIVMAIPEEVTRSGRVLLAVRVWSEPRYANAVPGGLNPAPLIGDVKSIAGVRTSQTRELNWEQSLAVIEFCYNLCGALAALALFVLRRKEREYLWLGLYLLTFSAYFICMFMEVFWPTPYLAMHALEWSLEGIGYYFIIEFNVALFGQRRTWLYVGAAISIAVFTVEDLAAVFRPPAAFGAHSADFFVASAVLTATFVPYWACLFGIVYRAARAGNWGAKVLLVPASWNLAQIVIVGSAFLFPTQAWAQAFMNFFRFGIRWPFPMSLPQVVGDLTNFIVLIVVVARYARNREDEERMEAELEAARTVQQVLIPERIPVIPGFALNAVYKPASQVGGDFFQIIAAKDGGVLAVIGDVSGKGMPAAMTVSMLVGTIRTLVHYTQSPGEILHAMNQRMLARSKDGFTTCLVLRADSDGRLTVANAGHIAPYVEGTELAVESGLPLGLIAEAVYTESIFALVPNRQITLLTDGVVEAGETRGELYGFERTAAISVQPAETIAQSARQFGQDDDITVITLTHLDERQSTAPAVRREQSPLPA